MRSIRRKHEHGDKRRRGGFLWFPRQAYNKAGEYETRWLEYAEREETYCDSRAGAIWIPRWVDDDAKPGLIEDPY